MASTTGPMLIEQFTEAFNRNIPDIQRNFYQFARSEADLITKKDTTTRWTNERQGYGGIAVPRRNRDLEPLPQVSPTKGYKTTIRVDPYRSQIFVEESLLRTAEHKSVYDNTRDVLQAGMSLQDAIAVNYFNNGFTNGTSGAGVNPGNILEADGTNRALFSTGHYYEDNSSTWSNYYNVGVPPTPEVVWLIILQYLGRLKDYANVNFLNMSNEFIIYTPTANPAFGMAAEEIIQSTEKPTTADRATNILRSTGIKLRHERLNWLTSTTKWFIGVPTSHSAYPLVLLEMEAGNLSPLASLGAVNPHAMASTYRLQFGVGFDKSYRGLVAIGT